MTFYTNGGHASGDHLYSIEGVIGSAYRDVLDGNDQRNVLRGEGGADLLFGVAGDDRLDGGAGNDELDGEAGADELRGGDGVDLAYYGLSARGADRPHRRPGLRAVDADGDRLIGIENVEGTTRADHLTGNAADNRLSAATATTSSSAATATTSLWAATGRDILDGGGGVDTLDYGSAAVPVTVNLATGFVLEGAFQTDTIAGFERLVGSAFGDFLVGSVGANTVSGGAGGDLLEGGLGRDELTGGAGADRFRFHSVAESGKTAATRDVVRDFRRADGDHLDLDNCGRLHQHPRRPDADLHQPERIHRRGPGPLLPRGRQYRGRDQHRRRLGRRHADRARGPGAARRQRLHLHRLNGRAVGVHPAGIGA